MVFEPTELDWKSMIVNYLFGAFQYYFDLIAVCNVLYFEQRNLEKSL